MDFAPALGLTLAVSLASVMACLGYLPPHGLRLFAREILFLALGWLVVALIVPGSISHIDVILALLTGTAWWWLIRDRPLGGKVWLMATSGLGLGVGVVVLHQAVRGPLSGDFAFRPALARLALLYMGGVVAGLAVSSALLLREEESRLIGCAQARALPVFTAGWFVLALLVFPPGTPRTGGVIGMGLPIGLGLLGLISWLASRSAPRDRRAAARKILGLAAWVAFGLNWAVQAVR